MGDKMGIFREGEVLGDFRQGKLLKQSFKSIAKWWIKVFFVCPLSLQLNALILKLSFVREVMTFLREMNRITNPSGPI